MIGRIAYQLLRCVVLPHAGSLSSVADRHRRQADRLRGRPGGPAVPAQPFQVTGTWSCGSGTGWCVREYGDPPSLVVGVASDAKGGRRKGHPRRPVGLGGMSRTLLN